MKKTTLAVIVSLSLAALAACKSAPKHEEASVTLPPETSGTTVAQNGPSDTMNLGASSAGRAQ